MKNIYSTSNSIEADAIVGKLSDNGINVSCRKKEQFGVVTGKNNIEFEIFVDDWEADKAKKLIDGSEYEQLQTPKANKRRYIVQGTAVVSLVLALGAVILSVVSAIN